MPTVGLIGQTVEFTQDGEASGLDPEVLHIFLSANTDLKLGPVEECHITRIGAVGDCAGSKAPSGNGFERTGERNKASTLMERTHAGRFSGSTSGEQSSSMKGWKRSIPIGGRPIETSPMN